MIIQESITQEDLVFENTEDNGARDSDFYTSHLLEVKKGTPVKVAVEDKGDGRIYRTAFVEKDGKYFCKTVMLKDGEVLPNCGGTRASTKIRNFYNK